MAVNKFVLRSMYERGEYGTGEGNRRTIQVSMPPDVHDSLSELVPVGKGGLGSATITLAVELLVAVLSFDNSKRQMFILVDLAERLAGVCGNTDMASFALQLVAARVENRSTFSVVEKIPDEERKRLLTEVHTYQ